MDVAIVKYNAGNIYSVVNAMKRLGIEPVLTDDAEMLQKADRVLFPGQGQAREAMEYLKAHQLDQVIKNLKQPVLGICVGQQLLCRHSEEGDVDCLGLLKGEIKLFNTVWKEEGKNPGLKVPQIGWNDLNFANGGSKLLEGVPEHSDFYFVHSYLIQPEDKTIVKAWVDYGTQVPACVESENITVFQCHPEKSGKCGLQVLKNFING